MSLYKHATLFFLATVIASACGSKSSSNSSDDNEDTTETIDVSTSTLAIAMPQDLAIDSPLSTETPQLAAASKDVRDGYTGALVVEGSSTNLRSVKLQDPHEADTVKPGILSRQADLAKLFIFSNQG